MSQVPDPFAPDVPAYIRYVVEGDDSEEKLEEAAQSLLEWIDENKDPAETTTYQK